jgi:hypothetical protein
MPIRKDNSSSEQMEVSPEGRHHEPQRQRLRLPKGQWRGRVVKLRSEQPGRKFEANFFIGIEIKYFIRKFSRKSSVKIFKKQLFSFILVNNGNRCINCWQVLRHFVNSPFRNPKMIFFNGRKGALSVDRLSLSAGLS